MESKLREQDLYGPMCRWFEIYLRDKYAGYEIQVIDAHSERLDRVLRKVVVICPVAIGIDIQVDIVGVAKRKEQTKLFFIEAKQTPLTLRDLGQLWAYCKLIDPDEAFLLTSTDLGSLDKILKTFHREDLLDFGDGKKVKKMKIGVWNIDTNAPEAATLIPKI